MARGAGQHVRAPGPTTDGALCPAALARGQQSPGSASPLPTRSDAHRVGVQPHVRIHVRLGLGLNGQLRLQNLLHWHVLVGTAGGLHLVFIPVLAPLPLLLHSCRVGGRGSALGSLGTTLHQSPSRVSPEPARPSGPVRPEHGPLSASQQLHTHTHSTPTGLSLHHSADVHTGTWPGPGMHRLGHVGSSSHGADRWLGRKPNMQREGFRWTMDSDKARKASWKKWPRKVKRQEGRGPQFRPRRQNVQRPRA